jgi:hypothetical protein
VTYLLLDADRLRARLLATTSDDSGVGVCGGRVEGVGDATGGLFVRKARRDRKGLPVSDDAPGKRQRQEDRIAVLPGGKRTWFRPAEVERADRRALDQEREREHAAHTGGERGCVEPQPREGASPRIELRRTDRR